MYYALQNYRHASSPGLVATKIKKSALLLRTCVCMHVAMTLYVATVVIIYVCLRYAYAVAPNSRGLKFSD